MIRLSIQARQALARLTVPVLVLAAFGLMLLGKADAVLVERARTGLADGLAPIFAVMAGPLSRLEDAVRETATLWAMRAENARLREENEKLRRWQSIALALDAENRRLKASLHWIPDPDAAFVTARVVADAGGVYAKAVLLSVGPNHGIRKGEIAVDERGLVGRITEAGARTARVLLITDLNSRIPVMLETSRAHAILVGTNGARPRLLYWPEGVVPQEGERVVSSAEANAFPANLPVGTVHAINGGFEVEPAAQLQTLEVVRIFDYGLAGVTLPDRQTPDRQTPDRQTPDRPTSDRSAPNRPTSDRSTPDRSTPERSTPERSMRDQPTPDRPTPDQSTPDQSTSKRSMRDRPTPDRPTPDQSTPGQSTPGQSTSDGLTPDRSIPDRPIPDRPIPDRPIPDRPIPGRPIPGRH